MHARSHRYLFNTGRRMNKTLVDGYTGERELMPAKNQMDGVHIRFDIGRSEAQLLSSSLTRRFVGLIRPSSRCALSASDVYRYLCGTVKNSAEFLFSFVAFADGPLSSLRTGFT